MIRSIVTGAYTLMIPQFICKMISYRLNNLDENDQDDDGKQHQRRVQPFIAIRQCQITDTAGPDSPGHSRSTDQPDRAGRHRQDKGAFGFRQQEIPDDFYIRRPHRLGRFDNALAHIEDRIFKKPRQVRCNKNDQRYQRRRRPDAGADNPLRQWKDEYHQDNEWDAANDVDDRIQHRKNISILQYAIRIGQYQQDRHDQRQYRSYDQGYKNHIYRLFCRQDNL